MLKKIKYFVFAILLIISFSLLANTSDSLRIALQHSKSIEQSINLYLDIGDYFEFENPDSAIYYYSKAKNLSLENIDKSEKIKILHIVSIRLIGFIHDNLSNYETAIEIFQSTIKLINEFKENASDEFIEQLNYQISSSFSNIGSIYSYMSKYDMSMDYYQKSLKICEKNLKSKNPQVALDAQKGIGKSYNNLGTLQLLQQNYKSALEYFENSIEYKTKVNDSIGICSCYNNIGVIYQELKDDDKALEFYNKALSMYEKLNNIEGIGSCYSNLASLYKHKKNYAEALKCFDKTIEIGIKTQDKYSLSISYNNLASFYNELGDYEKAINLANTALNYTLEIGSLAEQTDALSNLINSYKGKKDLKSAYKYAELLIQTKDSLSSSEKTKAMAEMETRYQSEKKQQEIEKQSLQLEKNNAEIKQSQIQKTAYLIGLLMMILLAGVIFRSFYIKKKANTMLSEMNAEILLQKEEIQTQAEMLLDANMELEKLSIIAQKTDNAIIITNNKTEIEWVNDAFCRLYGYSYEEYINKFGNSILKASSYININELINNCISYKQSISYISKNKTKAGVDIWVQTLITPLIEDNIVIKLIAIDSDITVLKNAEFEILKQRDTIAEQKKEMTDSILYAENIQNAIMPSLSILESTFTDFFILYRPKNIVSGDFYWTKKIVSTQNDSDIIVIAVADCTGHGVPGAFMSMLGIALLNEIFNKINIEELKVNIVLDNLRELLISSLNQSGKNTETLDGMDISIVAVSNSKNQVQSPKSQIPSEESEQYSVIDEQLANNKHLTSNIKHQTSNVIHAQWAGANNPLWIVRCNSDFPNFKNLENLEESVTELVEVKPDKMPIGLSVSPAKPFILHEFELSKNDIIYLFSDGYSDQFGGTNGRKLMSKNFKNTLLLHSGKTMNEQKIEIENYLNNWMNQSNPETSEPYEQVDDITILGIKI